MPVLHDQLPMILAEVREQLRRDWPDYAAFLDHEQGEVTTAARAFLSWLGRESSFISRTSRRSGRNTRSAPIVRR